MRITSFVTGVIAALLLGAPFVTFAQSPSPGVSAPPKAAAPNRIEERIKSLHDRLKITAAQEPAWEIVAQAMRDDAQKVGALVRERREKAATMNAVEDLRLYQAIAEAHAEGVAKLATTFEALYAQMPPAQQKIADAVFAESMHRPATRKKTN